jgi:alpha/beta superfamily hydrolase
MIGERGVSELRKLWVPGPAGRLEAAMRVACPARAAAVVTHPHPLHGGTLHNPVVFHADRALHLAGVTTLRFNFRGVGESEGQHDDGRGEVDDVGTVVSWLRGIALGCPLLLVGYSFGSWCAIRHAVNDDAVAGLIAIGLPVRTYPFDELRQLRRPLTVVQGSADEFGSPDEVRRALAETHPPAELLVVVGASHLFPGLGSDAAELVVRGAESMLASLSG